MSARSGLRGSHPVPSPDAVTMLRVDHIAPVVTLSYTAYPTIMSIVSYQEWTPHVSQFSD